MNSFLPWNQAARTVLLSRNISRLITLVLFCLSLCFGLNDLHGQVFSTSDLDFNGNNGVSSATSLMFGPDDRLYVLSRLGEVDIYTIQRNGVDDYVVIGSENISSVSTIPNHNDDGSAAGASRQATGLTVAGTDTNPVIYVTSSDSRIGGPSGDQGLDTNSGMITRLSWNGSSWDAVDIVRGLSRSEENHATNGLEFATVNGEDYLIVCSGGHANSGGPSDNFAWTTEYALSAAVLSINLTQIEALPILTDNSSGRKYIYDIPTLDDPTRANVNGIIDPDVAGYDGIDLNDPFGGNDGLNQAMIVPGGPVQIFSSGYRNTYDLVLTQNGRVYVTDNGANGGWGGLPENEGTDGTVTNNYNIDGNGNEIGSTGQHPTADGESVNNADHLHLATINRVNSTTNGGFGNAVSIDNYNFGDFYGGHPTPIRANPAGAGLFTNPEVNNYNPATAVFRTLIYDPSNPGPGFTDDPNIALPANWPPVPVSMANPIEGDWRGPGINNPDGQNDLLVTTWGTNTNGIDEYTASNFGGAMQGDLIAGKNGGVLRRVQLNADGSLDQLTSTWQSNLGGNCLGITCNGDSDPFPGTIWVAPFNSSIKVLEPNDLVIIDCILPGDVGYSDTADNDSDGYTNEDEIQSKQLTESGLPETDEEVICNPGNQPNDFDKALGGTLVSDLNDPDDDGDGIPDTNDPFQFGVLGSSDDAFDLPVFNELFSDNPELLGYLGLGFTGMMNNGDAGPNWTNWLDRRFDPTDANTNDILGGAVGAMTMQMTSGTALGTANNQDKAFQYGVKVDQSIGSFTVSGRMLNFTSDLQLYDSQSPTGGEIGFFIGDGTQSNYLKFVLTQNGLVARQEINDVPQVPVTLNLAAGARPNSNIELLFSVNAVTGVVTLQYRKDGGILETLGTIAAQGAVLTAIQTSAPLAVGLIGSSNTSGDEIEGTWDYLNVESTLPFVEAQLPDVEALINDPDQDINLDDYFGDDAGDGNLTYTVESNTNGAIGAVISGNTLTLSFPATEETGTIAVRATDNSSQFVEQTFTVNVNDEPVPVLRIRANGATIAATDAPNPDWIGLTGAGAKSGSFNGLTYNLNVSSVSAQSSTGRDASLPAYVPQDIFVGERYDIDEAPEMEWTFGLPNGNYLVRVYMANGFNGTNQVGDRVFDIFLEGQLVEDNLDLVDTYGHKTGGMKEYAVTLVDGTLNLSFGHVVENPVFNGIEILAAGGQVIPPIVVSIPDQTNVAGDQAITLAVIPSGGDPNANFGFTAQNLPPGLQIEPTTGLIFGDITAGAAVGSPYSSVVTVSKTGSTDAVANFTWTVTAPVGNVTWNDQTDVENYTARHECSFVQAGDNFYLFGGRENPTTLDVYDYQNKAWSQISNSAPASFNHFQAVEYQGLIWVIGAFKDNGFPNETPADFIWSYNPATDEWVQGPEIPASRKRGSAGLVVYNDKFYVIAGNTIGHNGGYIPWFDEFDPATGIWTPLADAPRARDHFHAAVVGDKLYVAGGRESGPVNGGSVFEPLIPEVDVFDFNTGSWLSPSSAADLPTPRAAASVAVFQDELYVIGGEIGMDLQGNIIDDAVTATESYNPNTDTWTTQAPLLTERHGTQAIVSGNGIHVAAGSNTKGGGGKMKNMEFYGTDNPSGTPLTASQLQTPASVEINANSTSIITAASAGGNTGIIITNAVITGQDAAMFSLDTPIDFALVSPGASLDLTVGFNGTEGGKTATLVIDYGEASTASITLNSAVLVPGTVLYRVNAGGPLTATNDVDPTDWSVDQATTGSGTANGTAANGTPSQYIDLTAPAADLTYGPPANTTLTNTTGYPDALFLTERYSTVANPNNMNWAFPVDNGDYTVNLLLAESFFTANDARIFDVEIEGALVLDDLDLFASYGNNVAAVETFSVTVTDGVLDINFLKGSVNNPAIKGIEILGGGSPPVNTAPVVDVVPNQFNFEEDNISLQVTASDIDPCTGLTYTATGLPPSLTIDTNTGLISGTLDAGSGSGTAGAFIESGGIVVIEMESVETLPGSWEDASTYSTTFSPNVNNPAGATGGDFLIWQGGQSLGNPGNGLLTYPVEITTPGVYKFQWRNQVGNGTNTTEHNDTWLKIEADAFYGQQGGGSIVCPKGLNAAENDCSGGAPEGAGAAGWFKVYSSGANNWSWVSNTSDNDAHQIYARFDAPGVYNILVSARSSSHAIDRMVLAKTDYSGNPQSLSLPESARSTGGVAGAADGSPYNVTVSVSDGCVPPLSTDVNFVWTVSENLGSNPEATVKVNSGGGLGSSTFGNNSFQIENTGDVDIVNVTINTATGFMMDVVFDPVGTAGDNAAKCLTEGTASVGDVGITVPADGGPDAADCESVFAQPHNGVDNDEGYDELTLDFTDFNPGELFAFGVDMDPTTIKGDLTAGNAGSISGFEMIGSTVTIQFANGAVLTTSLFDEGSAGGSDAVVNQTANDLNPPGINVGGSIVNQLVSDASQTINIVGGPSNGTVTLLQVDGRLYIDPGNPTIGYDIDPFEANEAMTKVLYSDVLNASGDVSIPVTLLQTAGGNNTPDGGLNHFIAVVTSPGGENSVASNVIVLEYDPNATVDASLDISYTLQGRNNNPGIDLTVEFWEAGELNPTYTFTPTGTGTSTGLATVTGMVPGDYEVAVRAPTYLQAVESVTLLEGNNTLDVGQLRGGDANGNNAVSALDFSILAGTFNLAEGSPGYNGLADFNGDGQVTALDFSILASNFNVAGEQVSNLANKGEVETRDRKAPSYPEFKNGVDLALVPIQNELLQDELLQVKLMVHAGEQLIDAVEAHLNYDKALLEIIEISYSDVLPVPIAGGIDPENGTIDLVRGTFDAFPTGTFELARITFRAKKVGQASIAFNPRSEAANLVTNFGTNVLQATKDANVNILTVQDLPMEAELFPVPTRDNVTVKVTRAADPANVDFNIYNVIGQMVLSRTRSGEELLEVFEMNRFTPGIYTLRITSGQEELIKRIIVE
ncbi:malectin domain-containing carbohydrate-binding protein [Neolewinella persica]|uniref:malectin domain-containing carbohydrate-binding protein n=1 Tax=Neolewinella persica TaxID=70998 RepID=UPI0003807178|nr:malectin domain-containing carbohydrate-binding protein [Neolewinella persica]